MRISLFYVPELDDALVSQRWKEAVLPVRADVNVNRDRPLRAVGSRIDGDIEVFIELEEDERQLFSLKTHRQMTAALATALTGIGGRPYRLAVQLQHGKDKMVCRGFETH